MKKIILSVLSMMVLTVAHNICGGTNTAPLREYKISDKFPASQWIYAFPVGNGRLGAMPFGDYPDEQILLNDETVWMGRYYEPNSMESMYIINDIRDLLWQGKYREAQGKTAHDFLASEHHPRCYQPLGFLKLHYLTKEPSKITNYQRILSMNRAVASNDIETEDGYRIRQEVFASHPDNVIVVRIRSLNGRKLSLQLELDRTAEDVTKIFGGNVLLLTGQAKNEKKGRGIEKCELSESELNRGVCFHGAVKVLSDGQVSSDEHSVCVQGAKELMLLVASATDYNSVNPYVPLREDRLEKCMETLARAEKLGYARLLKRHVDDFGFYFNRATVELGSSEKKVLEKSTEERINLMKKGGEDPDFIEDAFQMGRYILISTSREGTLPPNLLGIWNGSYDPKCDGDWHTNINIQENYWPAEITNLSELHEPLITLVDDIRKDQGKQMASKLGCRGFVISHTTHLWKQAVFSGHPFWGMWPTGGAWCCSHVMEHYRFTADKDYLKNTAYPILRDNVLFCLDWLTENPQTGELVSGPSISPENGFHIDSTDTVINVCMGPTMDQQIICESFTDFLEASRILGIADDLTRQVDEARESLAKTKIAPDGRIMEWDKNYREWQVNHRHYSHLYALYPGCGITPETPELFRAAAKSIAGRQENGGCPEGWSRAWLVNFYARLYEPEKAYDAVMHLMKVHTMRNMMHNEQLRSMPSFVDGNCAMTAGVSEMLLQSQGPENIIRLLPCLPRGWKTGFFNGLCARGGFEIDLEWKNGQARKAQVLSRAGHLFRLKCDRNIEVLCGHKEVRTTLRNGVVTFDTQTGKTYTLKFD